MQSAKCHPGKFTGIASIATIIISSTGWKLSQRMKNAPQGCVFCVAAIYVSTIGAESRNRTGTVSPPRDFESRASTYSAISATQPILSLICSDRATWGLIHIIVSLHFKSVSSRTLINSTAITRMHRHEVGKNPRDCTR